MKKINKKGFTLVELLAVIVVLAVVMVLATTTILPYMTDSRKNSFAIEANEAKNAAADAVSLIQIGTIKTSEAQAYEVTGGYCFDLTDLNTLGLWTKGDTSYKGKVVVKKEESKYTYTVSIQNTEFEVVSKSGDIDKDMVETKGKNTGASFAC